MSSPLPFVGRCVSMSVEGNQIEVTVKGPMQMPETEVEKWFDVVKSARPVRATLLQSSYGLRPSFTLKFPEVEPPETESLQ